MAGLARFVVAGTNGVRRELGPFDAGFVHAHEVLPPSPNTLIFSLGRRCASFVKSERSQATLPDRNSRVAPQCLQRPVIVGPEGDGSIHQWTHAGVVMLATTRRKTCDP